jgi:hypothetical protein
VMIQCQVACVVDARLVLVDENDRMRSIILGQDQSDNCDEINWTVAMRGLVELKSCDECGCAKTRSSVVRRSIA